MSQIHFTALQDRPSVARLGARRYIHGRLYRGIHGTHHLAATAAEDECYHGGARGDGLQTELNMHNMQSLLCGKIFISQLCISKTFPSVLWHCWPGWHE